MPDHEIDESRNPALRWYGWGSPVGLGLLVLLLSASVALIRVAFSH